MPKSNPRRFLAGVLLLALASTVAAQAGRNVRVLATFAPRGTSTNPSVRLYSDVWGYTAPDGREYALIAATVGVYVVDCSSPGHPKSRGFFGAASVSWKQSAWWDIKTYRNYAYVVSEGGAGVMILDLSDPDKPKQLGVWGAQFWPNAHSINIDIKRGTAWITQTRNGTFVLDLKRDPKSPSVLANFTIPRVHDVHLQGQYAHIADPIGNYYLIMDASRLPSLAPVAAVKAPGNLGCHSAWATQDGGYCLTTNEDPSGPVGVFDIRDPRKPSLVSTYRSGPATAILHNAFSHDRIAHVAYFTEGYRLVDLSDPKRPREIGFQDSWAGKSEGFVGVWGCYCHQPSGVVYVSDIQSGLLVVKPVATAARYGKATAGRNGAPPLIKPRGAAWLGNASFAIDVEKAAPGATAILVLGTVRCDIDLQGLRLNVWPFPPSSSILPIKVDPAGRASVSLPVPNLPPLDATALWAQVFVEDAQGVAGYSASRGLSFTLFTP